MEGSDAELEFGLEGGVVGVWGFRVLGPGLGVERFDGFLLSVTPLCFFSCSCFCVCDARPSAALLLRNQENRTGTTEKAMEHETGEGTC